MQTIDIRNFDLFFISYDEYYADLNFEKLKKIVPTAKRVHGVKGEFNAWMKAAELSKTKHFVTINADTEIMSSFSFLANFFKEDDQRVHVWRSYNPVNGLIYGHGTIHLFSKKHILDFQNFFAVDFALGAATKGMQIQEECASVTAFNKGPFLSWRSGHKEATKLASKTNIYPNTQYDGDSSLAKLKIWCSVGADAEFGNFVILGALMGACFGFDNLQEPDETFIIGDYTYYQKIWDEINPINNIQLLLEKSKDKLATRHSFKVETFSSEQSTFIKSLWYKMDKDLIDRLYLQIKS